MNTDLKIEESRLVEPIWCATGNVKKEISFGEEHIIKKGTKHFRGGAKVHVVDAYWGMCDNATVIGYHRSNGRYIKIDIPVKHLENFRLELVYSPKVIQLIQRNFDEKEYVSFNSYTKEYAENLVEAIPKWIKHYHQNHSKNKK